VLVTPAFHGLRPCGAVFASLRRSNLVLSSAIPALLRTPGITIHGYPVRRDKHSLDVCLCPPHPGKLVNRSDISPNYYLNRVLILYHHSGSSGISRHDHKQARKPNRKGGYPQLVTL